MKSSLDWKEKLALIGAEINESEVVQTRVDSDGEVLLGDKCIQDEDDRISGLGEL